MKVIYIEGNDSEPVVKDIKGDLAEIEKWKYVFSKREKDFH